jgi:3-phenylpropionate/cinnamic acid dioxygenase small subunit
MKIKENITVQDAMDNLAAVMSIGDDYAGPLGVVRKRRIVSSEEEFGKEVSEWVSGEGPEPILEILELTYRAIHQHLIGLHDSPDMNWENEKTRKGIAAMMNLVGESVHKIEKFLVTRMGRPLEGHVADREEFKSLQRFYHQQFAKKFPGGVEGEQAWGEEWAEGEVLASEGGLKDFETVKRDLEYELFYIRNEEGKPYFNKDLLRNIRLSCDFDADGDSFEEDPLLKIRAMQDRDLQASAGQILGECHPAIVDFFKVARKLEENELASSLGMAVMALMLATNPRHLIQNTMGKSCLQYFEDFHRFLRRAMRTSEYQKWIAYPPDASDRNAYLLLYLTHTLARSFFERVGGVKQEAIGLIHRTMRRGEEIKQKGVKGDSVWNQFLLDDEKLRTWLSQFPNGPLFKILDLIREEQDEDAIVPFDPIGQDNLPARVYQLERRGRRTEVIRLPSPTKQTFINKVEILDEFRGFLRSLGGEKQGRKHLLINLQDRTSWKEYTRARALESLQMNAEFSHQLFVVTLPKHTDFYYQNNEYLNLNQAEDFIKAFQAQLATPEECGFFLPPQLKASELTRFTDTALPAIHELFFEKKNTLTRKNREDFIEIFYQFFILKCIDLLEPTSLSFTCKDAIDTGAAEQAAFYGFIKLLTSDFSEREELDFLRWLLYAPALFIRERPIDPERLNRTIAALERFDSGMAEQGKQVLKIFAELYHPQTMKTLDIKHL